MTRMFAISLAVLTVATTCTAILSARTGNGDSVYVRGSNSGDVAIGATELSISRQIVLRDSGPSRPTNNVNGASSKLLTSNARDRRRISDQRLRARPTKNAAILADDYFRSLGTEIKPTVHSDVQFANAPEQPLSNNRTRLVFQPVSQIQFGY